MLGLIKQMEEDRRQSNKFPTHIIFRDLLERSGLTREELSSEIDRLLIDGYIETGRTINHDYIKAK